MASSKKKLFKLMSNPNPYSKVTCSAYGCDMRCGTNSFSEIKMFSFPRNLVRKRRWELATRRANWKSHSKSRLCSKHFITGRPSKDPNHPDYVPSIFVFNDNAQKSQKSKSRKKRLAGESCSNPACGNSSSRLARDIVTSLGIKGFCSKCFSSESVSSAFSQSLQPLNQTLTQLMLKLSDIEEEKEQLRNELALCRGEIHQLREAHQNCMTHLPSTSKLSKPKSSVAGPSTTIVDLAESSEYSDEVPDVYDSDLLPSKYLQQVYHRSDKATKIKRWSKRKQQTETSSDEEIDDPPSLKWSNRKQSKESDEEIDSYQYQSSKMKRVKSSSLESKGSKESSKVEKSSDTTSPITIIYLKR